MAAPNDSEDNPRNIADDDYNQKFNKTSNDLSNREKDLGDESSSSEKDLKSKEAAGTITRKTKPGSKEKAKAPFGKRIVANIHNKSAFAFVIVVIIMGIGYSSILAPNIILVNIKDLYTNDLADSTTALSKYTVKMLDFKLGKADCGEKESIKCKLTTMSRNQKLAFERHGFTVSGDKVTEDNLDDRDPSNDKPESRWKVNSIGFPKGGGSASDGESFAKLASKDDDIRNLANGVWNPRASFYMDARFKQRLKWQFDLTKNVTTSGTTEKEVDDAFDKSMQGSDEAIDSSGRGAFSLKTLAGKGADGLKQTSKNIGDEANSYTQLQCAYYTQAKVVYNDAKKAKEVTVARFAMQYLKAADQIKSGLTGPTGEITINTLAGKLAWSGDGGYAGANATDANIYRHIVMREPFKGFDNGLTYSTNAFDVIGALLPASIQLILTAKATKGITGAPGDLLPGGADRPGAKSRDYCLDGQTTESKSKLKPGDCPALTTVGAPPPMVPAVAPIAALSDRVCPPPPKGIWLMYPTTHLTSEVVMPYVAEILNSGVKGWADQVAKNFTHDTKGVAASQAIFTGTGVILGDMAMSRGMKPASVASLKEYLSKKSESDKEYEAIAKYNARKTPFNIYDQYSFAGSFVRSLSTTPATQTTVFSSLSNLFSVIPSSLSHTTSTASAIYNLQPDELDVSRLTCPDPDYIRININADAGCNVRYSMNKDELNANMKDVLDYMLKPHENESKKNVDELQERKNKTDFERDAEEVNRQYEEASKANGKPFIDEKTGKPTPNGEYEKFMNYCVNRQDPWGRSAMAVRREGLDDAEKNKRHAATNEDGIPFGKNAKSEFETKEVSSYMSITEGASADQDWYTGKKCTEDGEMLKNFRAYTMGCSVDGSFAGAPDCTEIDRSNGYTDDFFTSNDIQYLSSSGL